MACRVIARSDQTEGAKARRAFPPDDEVIMNLEAKYLGRLDDLPRDGDVRLRGRGVARRMVVDQNER